MTQISPQTASALAKPYENIIHIVLTWHMLEK